MCNFFAVCSKINKIVSVWRTGCVDGCLFTLSCLPVILGTDVFTCVCVQMV